MQHPSLDALKSAKRPWLTDGGFETTLVFHEGLDLPCFSAAMLLDDAAARPVMDRYFDTYLGMAAESGTGFVLDTATWRAGRAWTRALERSEADLMRLSREGVAFAASIRDRWAARVPHILINGVIGPAGDGYAADTMLTPEAAEEVHAPQVAALVGAGVDMISALTMTHSGEGVGLARAVAAAGAPVVISYTVETDGCLPSGQPLGAAIEETDAATGRAPIFYMINCAHPDHFRDALARGEGWLARIGGMRANASRMSHAELDNAEELDDGDPAEFGTLHGALAAMLPNLRVIGGCCGTDHRHVGCANHAMHRRHAA